MNYSINSWYLWAFVLSLQQAFFIGHKNIKPKPSNPIGGLSALIIGLAQAIAILPGISRSGSTIATALLLDIDRAKAARFSFLMVIPLIFGKMAKDAISGDFTQNMPSISYTVLGFLAAFLTGIWACTFMIKIVKNARLNIFAAYCGIVGLIAIIYGVVHGYY